MVQALKNKKTNFVSDFGLFSQNLGHQFFFAGFTSTCNLTLFQAIIQCNYKGKLMNQTSTNKKKILDPIFAC